MDWKTALLIGLVAIDIILRIVSYSRKKPSGIDEEETKKLTEENANLRAELNQKTQSIGEISSRLEQEKTTKDGLVGEGKVQYAQNEKLKAENTVLIREVSELKAKEEERKKELENQMRMSASAEESFKQERQRIVREDEEEKQREKEERNRIWAEHENRVKNIVSELCKSPQYNFSYHDNNNLPFDLPGKFKPDSIVEFLDQYVIFDAKKSESDMQGYINAQVKSTVEKINGNPKIYNSVFFIVPTIAMETLKKVRFYEDGYEFFVIPAEAIEAIFASFKKISSYELAQQLDPRDRENIVNLIAEFDYHINLRNALDIAGAQSGISVLEKARALSADIKNEIALKKNKIPFRSFTPTEIKTLMIDKETQQGEIDSLISPKASISEGHLESVKPILRRKKMDKEQE